MVLRACMAISLGDRKLSLLFESRLMSFNFECFVALHVKHCLITDISPSQRDKTLDRCIFQKLYDYSVHYTLNKNVTLNYTVSAGTCVKKLMSSARRNLERWK